MLARFQVMPHLRVLLAMQLFLPFHLCPEGDRLHLYFHSMREHLPLQNGLMHLLPVGVDQHV